MATAIESDIRHGGLLLAGRGGQEAKSSMDLEELKARYPELTFEEVGPNPDWSEDPVGYCFVIEAMPRRGQARVTVMAGAEALVAFSGDTVGLYKMLSNWRIRRDHLAYVAYELGRAAMALRHGLPYQQE